MKGRLLAAALVGFLLAGGSNTVSADPGNWAQLAAILNWLRETRRTVENIAGTAESMKNKLQHVWPGNVRQAIRTYFEPVTSIKQELEKLSCGWRFSLRMQRLDLALFRAGRFCRSEYRSVFGAPVRGPMEDLDEWEDHKATLRIDAVGEFNAKSENWRQEAASLLRETKAGAVTNDESVPYSPGYSQRLAALGAAQLGNFLLETGKLEAQYLDMTNDRIQRKRWEERMRKTWALGAYMTIAAPRPPLPGPLSVEPELVPSVQP